MSIILNISSDAERFLRETWGKDLDRAAFEALVMEGYRSKKFGAGMVRRLLDLPTRWDAEQWLGSHGVPLNYSIEDLESDRQTLDRLLGKTA
jgi:hypothetical protein